LSRTIFRNLDADPGFLTAAEVGGDGDNGSDPVLLAEVGGDREDDESEPRDTAEIDRECESDTDRFSLPCVGAAGDTLSASERGGDVTGDLLSFIFEDLSDMLFGEDELRTKFLCLAGRRCGDE
jgi:hypothetical protein